VLQRGGSAKQSSKLSLGQNKHGQNITTPKKETKKLQGQIIGV